MTPAITGNWNGILPLPDHPLPLGITFDGNGAALTVPEQGIFDMPLGAIDTDPAAVSFTAPGLPGDAGFHGRYDQDDLIGTFRQGGHDLPLTLHRGRVPTPPHPQDPPAQPPYAAEQVNYRSGDITIAGTLTLPVGSGPFPAVVMSTGSGPQDRDEEIDGHRPFAVIADALTRAGYAVLRTDDRGVGGTGGQLATADYTDLTDDITAGLNYLRGRADIDGNRIGLFGHSEGGYLAPLVASRPDARIAFVIMMAGPALPGDEILFEQNDLLLRAAHVDEQTMARKLGYVATLTRTIRSGDTDRVRELAEQNNATLPPEQKQPQTAIDRLSTENFDALVDYDPAPALRRLRMPVLAFYGGTDVQVPAKSNAPAATADLAADPNADVHVFPGLNHLMQPSPTGMPSSYRTNSITIAPEVLSYVTDWLGRYIVPAH